MTEAKLTEAQRAEVMQGRGHVTRYSDSSLYDEKCILCHRVDGSIMWPVAESIYNTDCELGLEVRALLEQEREQ